MASGAKRRSKGLFTRAGGLPVASRYLTPERRTWTLLAGLVGCGVALVALFLARLVAGSNPLAPGPVSSNHANFESRCAACHAGVGAPTAVSCRVCHERVGEAGNHRGTYSFAAHYAYGRPGGGRRGDPAREKPCAACHPEHRGRETDVTAVADALCLGCHSVGSFEKRHPEFRFAREHIPDDANLRFAHHPHVKELVKKKGFADPQLACLYCHNPDARGAGFQPLRFERHCGECHLDSSVGTPRLPIGDPADPRAPGVATLESLQRRWGPGVRWAFFTNPEEFQQAGNKIAKRPVYHEDPWILDNLRRIRRTLYPNLGLAELLKTAVDGGGGGGSGAADPVLTQEAIATLREVAEGLRGRPEREVQEELAKLDALLTAVEARVRKGEAVPAGLFAAQRTVNPALTAEQADGLKRLALELTQPCRQCHVVSGAAILRVQTDQRVLTGAHFSHRAHLLLRPLCTDCHTAIPGLGAVAAPRDERLDVAETQNIPTIATCRACHTARAASSRCVTCHLFHPDSSRQADLAVYRRAGAPGG